MNLQVKFINLFVIHLLILNCILFQSLGQKTGLLSIKVIVDDTLSTYVDNIYLIMQKRQFGMNEDNSKEQYLVYNSSVNKGNYVLRISSRFGETVDAKLKLNSDTIIYIKNNVFGKYIADPHSKIIFEVLKKMKKITIMYEWAKESKVFLEKVEIIKKKNTFRINYYDCVKMSFNNVVLKKSTVIDDSTLFKQMQLFSEKFNSIIDLRKNKLLYGSSAYKHLFFFYEDSIFELNTRELSKNNIYTEFIDGISW